MGPNDSSIGRAEALRLSMLAMMETEGKDYFAHPMFWAPFVVVGEGGVPKGFIRHLLWPFVWWRRPAR